MGSCIPFLGIVLKVFAVPIFFNSCCMHARDRTTLKGRTTRRDVEKKDGSLQLNNILINHAKDFCLAFLLFAWQVLPLWHKTHPKGLHRVSPAFCFSQQHTPALHCIKKAPSQRLHMILLTLLFMIIFLLFGTQGDSNCAVIKILSSDF